MAGGLFEENRKAYGVAKKTDTEEVWERISFWRIIVRLFENVSRYGQILADTASVCRFEIWTTAKRKPRLSGGAVRSGKKSADGDAEADIVCGRDFFQDAAG